MALIHISQHPLLLHRVGSLRDRATPGADVSAD